MTTLITNMIKDYGELLSFTWTSSQFSSFIFTILALVLTSMLAYFYKPFWGLRKVPSPPAIPILGHLPYLARHGLDVFPILAKRYGPIYRFHMGRQALVIVADADLCREVSVKKFKDMPNRSIPAAIKASPLYLTGLLWMRDLSWSTMKNTVLPLYKPSHLAKLIPKMQSIITTAAQNIPTDDQDVLFDEFALKLGTDVIGEATFGFEFGLSKPNNQKTDKKIESFVKLHMYSTRIFKVDLSGSYSTIVGILLPILQKPLRHILCRIPYTMDREILKANKKINDQVEEIVLKKMAAKERGSDDFLSLILNTRETDTVAKNLLTLENISGLTYEHLLGGPTTVSFTLSAIVYLLSGHPEIEKKFLKEIDAFGPPDQVPTANDLQSKFPYLDQVVKESMRFYPIFPLIPRETSTEVEIGGYTLPKGTWVWMAFGVLAKDPKHFPDPEKFKPERYDPNGEEEKQRLPYAFNPFGTGPRACLGEKFALQEIKLALIHLYQRYVFRHSPNMKTPLEFDYGIVLSFKHGLQLRAIKRA